MKYSKRKDKYCCNVLNDNFHEIDDRLNNLENGGGGSGGGGSCECNIVYLTQEEYDALPPSKESDDVEYRITNANTSINAARDWAYDNRISKLEATDVQSAIDEVQNNVSTVSNSLTNENSESFNFGYKDGVRGFYTNPSRADDCFIPFKSVGTIVKTESYNQTTATSTDNISLSDLITNNTILLIMSSTWTSGKSYSDMTKECYCGDSKAILVNDSYRYRGSSFSSGITRVYKFVSTESTMNIANIKCDHSQIIVL